ncbi:MAG TPA: hypothetical protein VGC14_15395 [Rhizobium sp.]
MEGKILNYLGKIAGIGGVGFGIFLLLFQGILQQRFLPSTGLDPSQAFSIIMSLMLLTFGIATIGVFAWLVSLTTLPGKPVSNLILAGLAALIVFVIGSTIYEGIQSKSNSAMSYRRQKENILGI